MHVYEGSMNCLISKWMMWMMYHSTIELRNTLYWVELAFTFQVNGDFS